MFHVSANYCGSNDPKHWFTASVTFYMKYFGTIANNRIFVGYNSAVEVSLGIRTIYMRTIHSHD